jgi:hypothetical protein
MIEALRRSVMTRRGVIARPLGPAPRKARTRKEESWNR